MFKKLTKNELREKSAWVRRETMRLHCISPETRLASSLSSVEILTVLFYGGILNFSPANPRWELRDRFIVSKGHGSISLYPILADVGFFPAAELNKIGKKGSFLGSIPDPLIPGYETINGSLGHGPGVGVGIAIGLKTKKSNARTIVLAGDGELYEGSMWEAFMLAAHQRLNNLIFIIDYNKISMLDYCEKIVEHRNLEEKFAAFGCDVYQADGHDVGALSSVFYKIIQSKSSAPRVLIANTIKGKGIPELETDHLCHIKTIKPERIAELLQEGKGDDT